MRMLIARRESARIQANLIQKRERVRPQEQLLLPYRLRQEQESTWWP